MRNLIALPLLYALTACAVGPDYSAPDVPVPAHFNSAADTRAFDHTAEQRFWQGFGDPQLASLIENTLAANPDLEAALARYQSAEALLAGTRREQWPSVTLGAAAAEQHLAAAERTPGMPARGELYQAGIAASWEPDLFGRLRRATQAQRAELAAAGADIGALQVALAGQLASHYFQLRGLQQQYLIAQQNIANLEASLAIVSARLDAGRGTLFDQVRARAQLATTRAALPDIDAAIRTTLHRIAVLTGAPPATLIDTLGTPAPLPESLPMIPTGSPGEALRRRPDIRAAEHRLAAATARIGVATADLFPRFSLDGLLGSVATDSSDLFTGAAESRRVALGIDWTFLDAGRVRARIDAAGANARAALANYQRAVLQALEETENTLIRQQRGAQRTAHLHAATEAAGHAVRMARTRYEQGFIDYFEVLAAEQELIRSRDALIRSQTEVAVLMVNLYRTLTGAPLPGAATAAR